MNIAAIPTMAISDSKYNSSMKIIQDYDIVDLEPHRVFASDAASDKQQQHVATNKLALPSMTAALMSQCEQLYLTSNSVQLSPYQIINQITANGITMLPESCHSTTTTMTAVSQRLPTNVGYQLTDVDILVGRDRRAFNHAGNKRFRVIISSFLPKYFEQTTRTERAKLVLNIIESIQESGGRFLKLSKANNGQYVEISTKEKRNKVAHALRDAAGVARCNDRVTYKTTPRKVVTSNNATTTNTDNSNKELDATVPMVNCVPFKQQEQEQPPKQDTTDTDDDDSLFDDKSIGVDFPIDLNLLMAMP